MKKFFLIPVLALFTCVSAWGGINYPLMEIAPDGSLVEAVKPATAPIKRVVMDDPEPTYVAQIGAVQYESLQEAFEAAVDNDVIELLANWSSGAWYAGEIDNKSLTIRGNGFSINGCLIVANETSSPITITYDGVTIASSSWEMYVIGDVTLNLANGSSNSMASSKNYGIFGYGNAGNLIISGNGSLTSSATYQFYQLGSLRVDAPNLTVSTTSSSFAYLSNNVVLNAGLYGSNPSLYVDFSSHVITKPSTLYVVAAPAADVVAYNRSKLLTYTSLAEAVADAAAGQEIYMYKNDAAAVSVSKNLTIHTQGFSNNLSAGDGYSKAVVGQDAFITDNALAAFLLADGTDSYVVSSNADISAAGAIHVHGTKTLTINEGVTVTYKRQGDFANIVVDEGAKLTVLGSGTFTPVMHSETRTIEGFTAEISSSASNQIGNRVIDVDGELVVGAKNDAANCPHFITSSIAHGSAVMVNETGVATFNNADMQVAMMSIKNYGNVTIHGGEYKSISTCKNGINNASWWAYHLNNEGIMTVNGGHFVGVQGAFSNANETAIVTINGGSFETVNGHNWATGEANTGANADNHYALYVACYSVVNVYGGYYKVTTPSAGGGKVALVGNNDAYNTYGIVNLYGGNFQRKVEVSPRKNANSSYPASIPTTSQWYGSFGSEAPLPAGYEYYETGDETYPWGVRAIAGVNTNEVESTEPTIPWQQNTTWSEDAVPETNTIVSIPVGKTVVVDKNESEKEAVAQQVFIAQGATLKVEEGTSLTVGEGGMNIGNGGQIVVEAGAMVKIGSAGVITTEDEALVIEASEDEQGYLVYAPATDENTQPKATVRLYTKSKQLSAAPYEYSWQRFAVPVRDITAAPANDYVAQTLFGGATTFKTFVYGWNGSAWYQPSSWSQLEPNKGYQIANNSQDGGITYTFTGNLVGNQNVNYEFETTGFAFFGNSYTAPVYVPNLLQGFAGQTGFEATIHVYDIDNDKFHSMTLQTYQDALEFGDPVITEIAPMQAFIIKGTSGNSADLDYTNAIWNNPRINPAAPAPARRMSSKRDLAKLTVSANGQSDALVLRQDGEYSEQFDNGADASKYMNENTFNFYANTELGNLSQVSTNDWNNTVLGFQSGDAAEYTLTCQGQKGEVFTVRDLMTGKEVEMTKGATLTFAQQPNTDVAARFIIVGRNTVPTAVETIENDAKTEGIYTMMGQYVGSADMLNTLPAGVYVVNGVKIVK